VLPDYAILIRLVVAALLAGALGWEREQAGKSAGLRTHVVVGIAAALYMGLAELITAEPGSAGRGDATRAIQAVAVGIGFLGGGIIFVHDDRVQGLTTAASIWATAAVGIAAGLGHFRLAAGATLLLVLVLHVLTRLERNPH